MAFPVGISGKVAVEGGTYFGRFGHSILILNCELAVPRALSASPAIADAIGTSIVAVSRRPTASGSAEVDIRRRRDEVRNL